MAEHCGHGKHDELVSPGTIPMAGADVRIEVQGQREGRDGEEGERKAGAGEEEGDDPLNAALSRTVQALGGDLLEEEEIAVEREEQRVEEEEEVVDQHPDK